jgi:hypothetical protein
MSGYKSGCVICEFAVTHLDEYLENNKTKDAVEAAIYGLCHRMPKSVKVSRNFGGHLCHSINAMHSFFGGMRIMC